VGCRARGRGNETQRANRRPAPRVSIISASSTPRRACASAAFELGAEVLPAGSARPPTLLPSVRRTKRNACQPAAAALRPNAVARAPSSRSGEQHPGGGRLVRDSAGLARRRRPGPSGRDAFSPAASGEAGVAVAVVGEAAGPLKVRWPSCPCRGCCAARAALEVADARSAPVVALLTPAQDDQRASGAPAARLPQSPTQVSVNSWSFETLGDRLPDRAPATGAHTASTESSAHAAGRTPARQHGDEAELHRRYAAGLRGVRAPLRPGGPLRTR
jgi:hypothetical protein